MKSRILNLVVVVLVATGLVGCTAVGRKVVEIYGNDLTRSGEIAEKYGKPDMKVCVDFLSASLKSEDAGLARLQELMQEETTGLLSMSLKAYIISETLKSLNDPAERAQFEGGFDTNCSKVAGKLVLNMARDGAKALSVGQ